MTLFKLSLRHLICPTLNLWQLPETHGLQSEMNDAISISTEWFYLILLKAYTMNPPLEQLTGSKGKLISATIGLMSAKGFESTSVQDIIEAAQVTKSNFYYHFKTKEELCLAALAVMEECFVTYILKPTLLNLELSPKNRLKAFFNESRAKMESNSCNQGCPFSTLASETSDFYPEFRERIAQFYQRQAKLIEQCFTEGIHKGEFRTDIPPSQASTLILSAMTGTMLLAKSYKDVDVISQNIDTVFQLISR